MFNVINQRLLLALWETLYYRDNLRLDLYHIYNYVVFLFSFGNFPKKELNISFLIIVLVN